MRIPLDVPPGLNSDDTAFASAPAWADMDGARFRLGRAQTVGGFEAVTLTTITGVCRTVFSWTDNTDIQHLAFGTHLALWVWKNGTLANITPSSGFTAGAIDGAGSAGWGTGAYGAGDYGEPSATDYWPLTWSLAAYGQTLLACPRNQTLFQWSNNTAVVAAAIANAPDNITYMGVAPTRQVFAFGCNEEVSGTFNPVCIRHSSIADITDWTTTSSSASTSREYILPGGGRIVGARLIGRSWLVWTNHALWLGTYYGQIGKVWSFDKVGDKCGLIGPNAAVVLGQTAYWVGTEKDFHTYTLGGVTQTIVCPIRDEFANNLAFSQADKVVASTITAQDEVRFDYPDARDGYENSRYLSVCISGPDAGAWSRGVQARTAMVDAGPSSYPCGVTYGGQPYWHEKGTSSDGAALAGYIETADTYLSDDNGFLLRKAFPDIEGQVGPLWLTVTTRDFAQGEATTYGPYTLTPNQDQVDFEPKPSGKLFRFKWAWDSAPAYMRMGRTLLEVKPRGRR